MFSRPSSTSELFREIVRRIGKLEKWQRDKTGDSPLFDIANEHTPDTLTTDQNDYDPGWYDVLRINATKDVTITGITKGRKGRFLEFYNVSNYKITLPYESGSSAAANRIKNSTGEDIVLFPTGRGRLYYDSTLARWVIPDPPSWTGTYGMSVRAYIGALSQTIPDNTGTKLLINTANPLNDEWGLLDATNNRIVIPPGMSGMWMGTLSGYWDSHAVAGNYRFISMNINGVTANGLAIPSIANKQMWHTLPIGQVLVAGDILEFYAEQVSGGTLDLHWVYVHLGRIR